MSNEGPTMPVMITDGLINETITISLIITEVQMTDHTISPTNGQVSEEATIDGPIYNRQASLRSFRLPRAIKSIEKVKLQCAADTKYPQPNDLMN